MAKRPSVDIPEGHELRGFVVRVYPTPDQEVALGQLQEQCRRIWNFFVGQSEDTKRAWFAKFERCGLIEPFIPWAAWAADHNHDADDKSGAEWKRWVEWRDARAAKMPRIPADAWRTVKDYGDNFGLKQDYQLAWRLLATFAANEKWPEMARPGAWLLQALFKNFYSKGYKQRRKRATDMPLRQRSGDCLELGDFGTRRGAPFYNCRVTINGIKLVGRLPGKTPVGRVLAGVALRREADGWFASVREVVPKRVLPAAEPGTYAGIDVGLVTLAAIVGSPDPGTDAGRLVDNSRDRAFAERIAGRQAQGKDVKRLHLQARRRMRQVCYEIAGDMVAGKYESVVVEKLAKTIGQMGSSRVSSMRTMVSILKERLGDRLREVDPSYTSQDCSQCGFRSKETWAFAEGRYGHCPSCGHREHRDVNAARNILNKYLKSLPAEAA